MKKLFLLFAAMCCMMVMHAEIVYHAKCEPTYMTVGYAQECWEDTETGKLYAEAGCTTELDPINVVTYKKLRKNPIVSIDYEADGLLPESKYHSSINEYKEYNGVPFNWASECYIGFPSMKITITFKVWGHEIANAHLKCYIDNAKADAFIVVRKNINAYSSHDCLPSGMYSFPIDGLENGDEVKVELNFGNSLQPPQRQATYAFSLEYTSLNGGDPDVIAISADNKRKIKGADDPELTYSVYPTSLAEGITGISVSREQGEELGLYPIHTSQAEGANPDHEIWLYDGTLEIVDGVFHEKGERMADGTMYLQDCWEETATGKYYADEYLEHELTPYQAIGYPKLPSNPIIATDGFALKESATYDGVRFDWAAETTYGQGEYGIRTVEFTVTEPNKYNNARLAWYNSTGSGFTGGHLDYAIYKNDVAVESYSQPLNESFSRGVFFVPLTDLKTGDKIKFEFNWRDGQFTPTVAACLQYICPQEFFLKAEEANSTVELKSSGTTESVKIQYSTDYSNWTTVDFSSVTTTGTITLANKGDMVYFRKADEGVASEFSTADNQFSFAMTGKIAASGNLMSLIDNTCSATVIPNDYCFAYLFNGCESLTAAPKLPATTLKASCYWCMFKDCTNLSTPPELPATTLAQACYSNIFKGCTSLTTAPVLPAEILKPWCYLSMFENCTSLTTAPELPVTTLAEACYSNMFKGCTSLTTAPVLPAALMAVSCYYGMFSGCTKLESAPALNATSLASKCYSHMFEDCTSLTAAPKLPATILASECYRRMFFGCTKLESAPKLEAETMAEYCYEELFAGCTSLTAAPALPAATLAIECYKGMFSGCTNLKSAPELPATEMRVWCYAGMFEGCTSLATAPELPSTTLQTHCYEKMFSGCTNLTTAPELPATALLYMCYDKMFNGCEKLNYIKVGCTSWMHGELNYAEYPTTADWLKGVAETGTFVCPDALDKTKRGTNFIPEGWTPVFEVKANNEPETENYYSTFYSKENAYQVPNGVTAYTGKVEESASNPDESVLKLTAIKDGIIPADEPVILKATQSQVYLPYTTTSATKSTDNNLNGTDVAIDALGANDYALSLGQNGVGFYPWEGKAIGANKAYLTLTASAGAKAFTFDFNDGETTGILKPVMDEKKDSPAYNLNGVRVNDNYKGIVIKNGKKIYQK